LENSTAVHSIFLIWPPTSSARQRRGLNERMRRPIPALGSSARTTPSLPASSGSSGQTASAIASAITVGV
jgi:hypothetical protein